MAWRSAGLAAIGCAMAMAVIIDRIAIVVDNQVINDSDIAREIHMTDFINGDPLDTSAAARKKAASRLIDQALIRHEIQLGEYSRATPADAQSMLDEIRKQRYKTAAAYEAALHRYGITQAQLLEQLQWQMTVLQFIDQRFKPGIMISDAQIQQYYNRHAAQLTQAAGGRRPTLDEVRQQIEDTLAGEEVNKEFYAWLDQQRKQSSIEYHEAGLK
jgi:parvulin-like peptidyl-prolyl isomerase